MMRLVVLLLLIYAAAAARCPQSLKAPCTCSSTRYEAVSIVCDKAASLDEVIQALANPPSLIDSLAITNTPIEEIPGMAFFGFNIKKLVVRNCGLRDLHPDAFGGNLEDTLEELELRGNMLEMIPQNGLPELRSLKVLSLADNVIDHVGDNAFLTYHSRATLERLDLSSNNISRLSGQSLLGLEVLQQLSLDKNQFITIPSDALALVPTLEDLSLGVNQIERVLPGNLPLPNLKSLSLEVNKLKSIPADAFSTVPQLAYLYLGNNLFTQLDGTMFFYISQLKVLNMGNNKDLFTIGANALQYTPLLVRLEMAECNIDRIEPTAFHKIPKIQVITLGSNQLTHVHSDTFAGLRELVSLDLSDNAITTVDDYAFSRLPSLSFLDLSRNRLETLPENMLYETLQAKSATKQRMLYLHNNPWRCDDELAWIRKWLRENGDIQISAPGGHTAKCWSPSQLSGLDVRQTDPIGRPPPVESVESVRIGETMRKFVRTSTTPTPPPMHPVIGEETRIEGVSLVAMILGIVLGILGVCVIIIFVIRCFMQKHEKKEVHSQFGSNSLNSGFGSSYSGAHIFSDRYPAPRGQPSSTVFLNRPRNWWF